MPVLEDERDGRLFIDAIDKAFAILECFSDRNRSLSIAQLSTLSGIGRSATQRIVYTLIHVGYLKREGAGRQLSLAPKSLSLGAWYRESDSLVSLAQPYMLDLSDRFDETVTLARLERDEIVVVARVPSTQVLSAQISLGSRFPASHTASGNILKAYAQGNGVGGAYPGPSEDAGLKQVRKQGYCSLTGPAFVGGISFAAPVMARGGEAAMALAISCPRSRWEDEVAAGNLVAALMEAADRISVRHGWQGTIARG